MNHDDVSDPGDPVDAILEQWRRERPDLDVAPMGLFGRLGRFAALASRQVEQGLEPYGLTIADFDVLAALRRAGEPCELKPTDLSRMLMLSPAGMTNRLDRLERAGHVERRMDPEDRRCYLVRLTIGGRAVIDRAVTDHVSSEAKLLSTLSRDEQVTLDRLLRRLLGSPGTSMRGTR